MALKLWELATKSNNHDLNFDGSDSQNRHASEKEIGSGSDSSNKGKVSFRI
jgi:hypothetical protein